MLLFCFFFFSSRRRHTRLQGEWSSDVCSSDLIVLPHKPHFIGQPEDVNVFWGYGLFVDKQGDFVKKPMSACTGREIMSEILGHLHIESEASQILNTSICIPCMMPFITSQFLRRERGDRPAVVPQGSTNLAFTGQ